MMQPNIQGASPQAATGLLPYGWSPSVSIGQRPTIDPMARSWGTTLCEQSPAGWLPLRDSALHCVECATARRHPGARCGLRLQQPRQSRKRFVARLLRRSALRENSPSPSSPPIAPRFAMRGALGGDARRAKARFLTSTNPPTPNPRPAGGGFLPPPPPSGGNEERPKREDAFLSPAAPPAPLALM